MRRHRGSFKHVTGQRLFAGKASSTGQEHQTVGVILASVFPAKGASLLTPRLAFADPWIALPIGRKEEVIREDDTLGQASFKVQQFEPDGVAGEVETFGVL